VSIVFAVIAVVMGIAGGIGSVASSDVLGGALPAERRSTLLFAQSALGGALGVVVALATARLFAHRQPLTSHVALQWAASVFLVLSAMSCLFVLLERRPAPAHRVRVSASLRVGLDAARTYPWFRRYLHPGAVPVGRAGNRLLQHLRRRRASRRAGQPVGDRRGHECGARRRCAPVASGAPPARIPADVPGWCDDQRRRGAPRSRDVVVQPRPVCRACPGDAARHCGSRGGVGGEVGVPERARIPCRTARAVGVHPARHRAGLRTARRHTRWPGGAAGHGLAGRRPRRAEPGRSVRRCWCPSPRPSALAPHRWPEPAQSRLAVPHAADGSNRCHPARANLAPTSVGGG